MELFGAVDLIVRNIWPWHSSTHINTRLQINNYPACIITIFPLTFCACVNICTSLKNNIIAWGLFFKLILYLLVHRFCWEQSRPLTLIKVTLIIARAWFFSYTCTLFAIISTVICYQCHFIDWMNTMIKTLHMFLIWMTRAGFLI